jgi:polyisoprenoid-binding protein YceI
MNPHSIGRRCAALLMASLVALLVAALCAAPAAAAPQTYALDPQNTWVHFELSHFGTSTIRGRLGPARGVVVLDAAARSGDISIEIDTASLSTGLGIFDERIRRDDLLATAAFPTAWFVSRTLQFDGERLVAVRGELTLRGHSLPLTLTATRFRCAPHPQPPARELCGGDFEGRIKRSDAGIDFGLPFVGDDVTLRVQVEGTRALGTQ